MKLGQLEEAQQDADIEFSFAGKDYKITPTVEQVLEFHLDLEKEREAQENDDASRGRRFSVLQRVAPLLGSKFNPKTTKITGGVLKELIDAGMGWQTMNSLVGAIHLNYTSGSPLAEEFFKTGNLGKALQAVSGTSGETQNPGTQTDAGATTGDD